MKWFVLRICIDPWIKNVSIFKKVFSQISIDFEIKTPFSSIHMSTASTIMDFEPENKPNAFI